MEVFTQPAFAVDLSVKDLGPPQAMATAVPGQASPPIARVHRNHPAVSITRHLRPKPEEEAVAVAQGAMRSGLGSTWANNPTCLHLGALIQTQEGPHPTAGGSLWEEVYAFPNLPLAGSDTVRLVMSGSDVGERPSARDLGVILAQGHAAAMHLFSAHPHLAHVPQRAWQESFALHVTGRPKRLTYATHDRDHALTLATHHILAVFPPSQIDTTQAAHPDLQTFLTAFLGGLVAFLLRTFADTPILGTTHHLHQDDIVKAAATHAPLADAPGFTAALERVLLDAGEHEDAFAGFFLHHAAAEEAGGVGASTPEGSSSDSHLCLFPRGRRSAHAPGHRATAACAPALPAHLVPGSEAPASDWDACEHQPLTCLTLRLTETAEEAALAEARGVAAMRRAAAGKPRASWAEAAKSAADVDPITSEERASVRLTRNPPAAERAARLFVLLPP